MRGDETVFALMREKNSRAISDWLHAIARTVKNLDEEPPTQTSAERFLREVRQTFAQASQSTQGEGDQTHAPDDRMVTAFENYVRSL